MVRMGDVFSGVGPITISAAKKVKYVYANDLNPSAVEYLVRNIVLNKMDRKIESARLLRWLKPLVVSSVPDDIRAHLRGPYSRRRTLREVPSPLDRCQPQCSTPTPRRELWLFFPTIFTAPACRDFDVLLQCQGNLRMLLLLRQLAIVVDHDALLQRQGWNSGCSSQQSSRRQLAATLTFYSSARATSTRRAKEQRSGLHLVRSQGPRTHLTPWGESEASMRLDETGPSCE
ncbi:tRNA (guanine(37)-N1)-methyltransferase 1 [Platanthera guangdongensis]|uniref:tRNA (Guanine(37)-N1)-methyltransferase 1 n=1 Tax=Platanthera guangdongensis TaxID=2320717 RepID=A0ABR2MXN5_9ASPA